MPQRSEAGMVVESVEVKAGGGGPEDRMDPERTPVEVSGALGSAGWRREAAAGDTEEEATSLLILWLWV